MIVYLGSRDEAAGAQAANSLKAEGEVHPIRLDITARTTMEADVQRDRRSPWKAARAGVPINHCPSPDAYSLEGTKREIIWARTSSENASTSRSVSPLVGIAG